MHSRTIAVLPLSSTGVILIHRRTPSGEGMLGIPRGADADAASILWNELGVEAEAEELGDTTADADIALYRARLSPRARPQASAGGDAIAMNFATFEAAIAAGRISDLATIAAWMRHRLIEGETTRRRRLPKTVDWTPERLDMLSRMWREGSTGGEIAKALDVTRNAVMGRIHRMGLSGQGGSIPPGAAQDARMRRRILDEFRAAFDRDPVNGRSGDKAMLVALAAMQADRSPNVVARWSGVDLDEVMAILQSYHERGLWHSDDPVPERWTGPGRLLAMMLDAQIAYGIFRHQRTS